MCLYEKRMDNPRYKPNGKNGGIPPIPIDERLTKISIGCGKCKSCRTQRANKYRFRLASELRYNNDAQFVTLTFDNDALVHLEKEVKKKLKLKEEKSEKLKKKRRSGDILTKEEVNKIIGRYDNKLQGYDLENEIATLAIERFRERWRDRLRRENRKEPGIKYFAVTELGENKTERIHIHMIAFIKKSEIINLNNAWQYGIIHVGEYVNEETVNYIVKYLHKPNRTHKEYVSKTFISKGIGLKYLEGEGTRRHEFKGEDTNIMFRLRNGIKIPIDQYTLKKMFNDEQMEIIRLGHIKKGIKWIDGVGVPADNKEYVEAVLKDKRMENKRIGYHEGDKEPDIDRIIEEREKRDKIIKDRNINAEEIKLKGQSKYNIKLGLWRGKKKKN